MPTCEPYRFATVSKMISPGQHARRRVRSDRRSSLVAGLVLFSLVLLLATSTLQAVHSCGGTPPAREPGWQSAGLTASHRAVCVLCANAGTAMPQAAAVHDYSEPAARTG